MSDIQKARDVLTKWREGTSPGPWKMWEDDSVHDECGHAVADGFYQDQDTKIVIGTAGNPDLLDAIDGLLARAVRASEFFPDGSVVSAITPIAAAILAADERMSA